METCRDCPQQYPWLGDSEGTGIVNRDNYNFNGNGDPVDGGEQQNEGGEESQKKKWANKTKKITITHRHQQRK